MMIRYRKEQIIMVIKLGAKVDNTCYEMGFIRNTIIGAASMRPPEGDVAKRLKQLESENAKP